MLKRFSAMSVALLMALSFMCVPALLVSAVPQDTATVDITCDGQVVEGTYYVRVGLFKNYKAVTVQFAYVTSLPPENIASVEWTTTDKHISIDQTGKIRPTKNGKCSSNITVKITDTDGKSYTDTVLVKLYKFSWDKEKKNY